MITNPNNALGAVSQDSNYYTVATELKNTGAAAISAGDTVALKYTVSGTLLECEEWDTNAAGQTANIGVGVAYQNIPVNGSGLVTIFGFARVNVASATVAEGEVIIGTTTAGEAGSATADATTVVGTVLGICLGVKDANNRAPMWVSPR